MPRGIQRAKDRKDYEWEGGLPPAYADKEKLSAQMKDWLDQWNLWIDEVLLPELYRAADELKEEKRDKSFGRAMERIQDAGDKIHKAGCTLLDKLNRIYPYSEDSEKSKGKVPPIVGDSTKPPPAPFGGGI